MLHCEHPNCGWTAIAPSERVARERYVDHLLDEHTREVDAEIPEGTVQVKVGDDDEWTTVPLEEARQIREEFHRGESTPDEE